MGGRVEWGRKEKLGGQDGAAFFDGYIVSGWYVLLRWDIQWPFELEATCCSIPLGDLC